MLFFLRFPFTIKIVIKMYSFTYRNNNYILVSDNNVKGIIMGFLKKFINSTFDLIKKNNRAKNIKALETDPELKKAGQLKAKVATLDKAIAKELDDIDKSIEQNRKAVEKRIKKLSPERQKTMAMLAKVWSENKDTNK